MVTQTKSHARDVRLICLTAVSNHLHDHSYSCNSADINKDINKRICHTRPLQLHYGSTEANATYQSRHSATVLSISSHSASSAGARVHMSQMSSLCNNLSRVSIFKSFGSDLDLCGICSNSHNLDHDVAEPDK